MTLPDAIFLDLAAGVKIRVRVPVIAVGRLGDPAVAEEAVASGKTDLVALGRALVADPQWVAKIGRGEPIRRCLACNTCINEMRGGARIGCVVNAAAGRERLFAAARPPQGERIAVIGAGPAGLTYAALAAEGNEVTVFEREGEPGGAFRHVGKAPLFQEVAANEASFARYIADLVAACEHKGVVLRLAIDVARRPDLLAPFQRIVVATGARYRFGLGPLATMLLAGGRAPLLGTALSSPRLREWLYRRARRSTADDAAALARPDQKVVVIGDALRPGKSKEAIASAFAAAFFGRAGEDDGRSS
jgi:hypothetical protein